MSERLRGRHGIRVRLLPVDVMGERLRWYDLHRRQLLISEIMDQPGRTFQAAYQLAISEHGALINAVCAKLEPRGRCRAQVAARDARPIISPAR